MDRLADLLPQVLARQPRSGRVAELRIQQVFREVLGEDLATACERIEVHGSAIAVTTGNPALAHQLRLDAGLLLRRLNEECHLAREMRVLRVRVGRAVPPGEG
ncbi:MAG TPA: DUF721 domain-containing protein [Candidatus Dormibacteraeota bacterium]|nr:DUF721 domain-containing protein [Candidatus Dormibacteraeota bacterium]